jgi:hypothetical protein
MIATKQKKMGRSALQVVAAADRQKRRARALSDGAKLWLARWPSF